MRGVAAVALVLLLCLPLGARAQAVTQSEACRAPVLALQPASNPFPPGGSESLIFANENPNGAPVEAVRATVTTTAPAGWTASVAQRELTLGPRNASFNALAITAPNRGSGAAEGNITLLVTFVCTSGDIQTFHSTTRVIEVRISQFEVPWPVVLTGFLVLLAGVTILGVRRLRRGVALSSPAPDRTVEAGKSVKFTFLVENRRGKPQRFALRAIGVPEGWSIHLALEQLELEPGEEKTLWAILKAPASALPGAEADVELALESEKGAARESVATRVRARVVPPS
jgi:hypothetical protein